MLYFLFTLITNIKITLNDQKPFTLIKVNQILFKYIT